MEYIDIFLKEELEVLGRIENNTSPQNDQIIEALKGTIGSMNDEAFTSKDKMGKFKIENEALSQKCEAALHTIQLLTNEKSEVSQLKNEIQFL